MPALRLPIFDQSLFQQPLEQQVKTLADFIMRYRRELEYLLNGQLDDDNGVFRAATIISNAIVTNVLTAQKGYIAELTVDRIDTSDMVQRFLLAVGNPLRLAPVGYWRGNDKYIEFIDAQIPDPLNPTTVQVEDRTGAPLYWIDAEHIGTGITTDVTDYPVMRFVYNGTDGLGVVKLTIKHEYDESTGYYTPVMEWGAGFGSEAHPERGKGFFVKDTLGLLFRYIKADGTEVWMRLGENGAEGSLGKDVEVTAIEFNTEGMDVTYADDQVHNWDFITNEAGRIIRLDNLSTNRSIAVSYSGV